MQPITNTKMTLLMFFLNRFTESRKAEGDTNLMTAELSSVNSFYHFLQSVMYESTLCKFSHGHTQPEII